MASLKQKLCCMINPQFYCSGCKTILCGECSARHFGVVDCCLNNMKGHKWIIKHYEEHLKKQIKEEALTFRFEEGTGYEYEGEEEI